MTPCFKYGRLTSRESEIVPILAQSFRLTLISLCEVSDLAWKPYKVLRNDNIKVRRWTDFVNQVLKVPLALIWTAAFGFSLSKKGSEGIMKIKVIFLLFARRQYLDSSLKTTKTWNTGKSSHWFAQHVTFIIAYIFLLLKEHASNSIAQEMIWYITAKLSTFTDKIYVLNVLFISVNQG